jgi:hypothetical protein
MDTEALSAYREAEAVLPTDVQHKLTLANHLLYWHDRPAESLTKAEEALALARSREGESSWLGQARGLRGVALLRLGNIGAAQEAWAEILAIASAPEATPADLDLFLAAELIDARLLLPEVGQYLKMVALKAATTSSYDLSERCARVEEKLKAVQGE